MFLLVLAHPGSPGQRAIKRLLLLRVVPVFIMGGGMRFLILYTD